MFTQVIVKRPSKTYVNGLTTSDLGAVNYELLLEQYEAYVHALEKCKVYINHLQEDERFPDSTFVEDTAVVTADFAVLMNPGAKTRNGEIHAILPELEKHYKTIYQIEGPGFIDGGDVLQADQVFYIGLSERTNAEGARQLQKILEEEKYTVHIIPLQQFFHLKTGIAYLGNNKMVIAGEYVENPLFEQYEKIIIPEEDQYSANCIVVNDFVLIPKGFEQTKQKIEEAGFEVIELNMSEFQKQDGGLSCLSLRF